MSDCTKIPPEHERDVAALPQVLRDLLLAELAAGNAIVEVGHTFPAPPAGAWFKLARPVSTRARASGDGIDFHDRGFPGHSGEFTDGKRFHFLLEPPHPPPEEPDMDAMRAAREARQRAADAELYRRASQTLADRGERGPPRHVANVPPPPAAPPAAPPRPAVADAGGAVERFERSMVIDYDKWHDGIGYDLDVLRSASAQERERIEEILVARGIDDWRDVEALAALDSPRARRLLAQAAERGNQRVRLAVSECAPHVLSETRRTELLVAALRSSEVYGGLTQALLQVETFHPPAVIDALFAGVLDRDGATATHFAAMLMFVHGKADSAFDMTQRPYFLRFHTDDRREREAMLRDLCGRLGVDPEQHLRGT